MVELEIYSGRRILGIIRQRKGAFEVFGDDFEPLGKFSSLKEAEAAVHAAVRTKDAARVS